MNLIHNNIYNGIYNNLSLIGTQMFYQVCILKNSTLRSYISVKQFRCNKPYEDYDNKKYSIEHLGTTKKVYAHVIIS